jgi:hypothetical protein
MHTDVVPTGGQPASPAGSGQQPPPGSAEEKWAELRCLEKALTQRICAEGFDD